MKHYGKFLFNIGREVKDRSSNIEDLLFRRNILKEKLKKLNEEIAEYENEFLNYIGDEWSAEEILDAKKEAVNKNRKRQIK